LGIVLLLDGLDIIDFNPFFEGWWTLFIIIPCLIGLITERDKAGNLIGLLIGIGLFLAVNDYLSFRLLGKMILPVVMIILGLRLVLGNAVIGKKARGRKWAEEHCRDAGGEILEYCATFSSIAPDLNGQTFYGAELTAVFGSVRCDLRNAVFTGDTVIKVSSIFGGIEILLPEAVNVSNSISVVFGGASCDRPEDSANTHTVYISGIGVFGGVTVK
jgi:predicted membrane protein